MSATSAQLIYYMICECKHARIHLIKILFCRNILQYTNFQFFWKFLMLTKAAFIWSKYSRYKFNIQYTI